MKAFYESHGTDTSRDTPGEGLLSVSGSALVAVYDTLTASPRVITVSSADPRELIEMLASRTYELSHSAGGAIPYAVIREVVENFIHAGFDEVVVSVLDSGNTIRCADQGPGIKDKSRAFLPGFSTATRDMKSVIKGVGSGLPVARECLTFSGGTIEIEDNIGTGTVVTMRMNAPVQDVTAHAGTDPTSEDAASDSVALTVRQKQVLSLAMELGVVGPTVVSRELGVGLSTAYRDLEHLSRHGLLTPDDTGKRALTRSGTRYLDALFGR
jgi:anti-sigma regulatory factor (Ser/Thr protein kinase)